MRRRKLPARIARHLCPDLETGCLRWTGAVNEKGYGRVAWEGRNQRAHRVVYKILVGPIPKDRPQLDHVKTLGCAWNDCCEPAHLEPVTNAENARRAAEWRRAAMNSIPP